MEQVVSASREERKRRWHEHVEGQKRNGLKVATYCEANGLNAGQFWYWRRALRPQVTNRTAGRIVAIWILKTGSTTT